MKQCRLIAAEHRPFRARPASFGSLPAFACQMVHDFHRHPLSASLNHHHQLLKNDQVCLSENLASTPSQSHAFDHLATPSFDPETSLKRVETTLKWLETRLKRLEINVESLKRFNQSKNSTSIYQRLTEITPLKR